MRRTGWWAAPTALAALLLAATPAHAAGAHPFPLRDTTLYPSADGGAPPGFAPAPALMREQAGAAGQAMFLPVLGVLGLDQDSKAWLSDSLSGATYRLASDSTATLDFGALNVEAVASFTVTLSAVDAAGHATQLGSASRTFNLPRLLPTTESFTLPTAGQVLPRGDALRLEVRADAVDVLTTLNYGAGSATALHASYRLLDTDGDGIPDDADPCPLQADCNADGTGDGDASGGNGTTVYHTYLSWYNTTGGTAPPGTSGSPGGSGSPGVPGAPGTPGAPSVPPTPPAPGTLGGTTGVDGGNGSGTGAASPPSRLRLIEASAGGFTLATGTTLTSIALLRRRP